MAAARVDEVFGTRRIGDIVAAALHLVHSPGGPANRSESGCRHAADRRHKRDAGGGSAERFPVRPCTADPTYIDEHDLTLRGAGTYGMSNRFVPPGYRYPDGAALPKGLAGLEQKINFRSHRRGKRRRGG